MSRPQSSSSIVNVLSIAGVDPSGGAGLLADIKTFSALGAFGCGAVTALTAQNTRVVSAIHEVPRSFLQAQLDTLFADVRIHAVKIGMLASAALIRVVEQALAAHRPPFVVLDPVMVAKSGDRLLMRDAVMELRTRLLPAATIVTPNLPEASDLLERPVGDDVASMRDAAKRIHDMGARAVLLKGGHGNTRVLTDVLFDGVAFAEFRSERIDTRNTHGTGCTFSSAIAALLPQRDSVAEAVRDAHDYVAGAIRASNDLDVGSGHGPLNHFHLVWRRGHPAAHQA